MATPTRPSTTQTWPTPRPLPEGPHAAPRRHDLVGGDRRRVGALGHPADAARPRAVPADRPAPARHAGADRRCRTAARHHPRRPIPVAAGHGQRLAVDDPRRRPTVDRRARAGTAVGRRLGAAGHPARGRTGRPAAAARRAPADPRLGVSGGRDAPVARRPRHGWLAPGPVVRERAHRRVAHRLRLDAGDDRAPRTPRRQAQSGCGRLTTARGVQPASPPGSRQIP